MIVYCLKAPGARCVLAAETLGEMGYTNVVAMQGGLEEWRASGLDKSPEP
jgi:rhodanese-related sulfurtransferase